MAPQYLNNNHVTYYVITQVGVYAAQQWYVLHPTWRGTAGQPESQIISQKLVYKQVMSIPV